MDFILVNFRYRESAWDGSGNLYVVQRNKDCNVQPDAAATEWKLGHAPKKSLMMTKG
jgi:hypothetical protein